MSWNNGYERKKFEQKQRTQAKEYSNCGMSESQIFMIYGNIEITVITQFTFSLLMNLKIMAIKSEAYLLKNTLSQCLTQLILASVADLIGLRKLRMQHYMEPFLSLLLIRKNC